MEKVYWTILWTILFAGIIYVNSAEQVQPNVAGTGRIVVKN